MFIKNYYSSTLSSIEVRTDFFIEHFDLNGLVTPDNFVLLNRENLNFHSSINFLTNRYANLANLGEFKTDLISREIVKVNRHKKETMLFQINSKSFNLRIRLIEPAPLVKGFKIIINSSAAGCKQNVAT